MGKTLSGLLYIGGSHLFQVAAGVLTGVLLTNVLSPASMGQYALLIASATLLHSIFLQWTQASFIRFGKEHQTRFGTWLPVWRRKLPLLGAAFALSALNLLPPLQGLWLKVFALDQSGWLSACLLVGVLSYWVQAESNSILRIEEHFGGLAFCQVTTKILWAAVLVAMLLGTTAPPALLVGFLFFLSSSFMFAVVAGTRALNSVASLREGAPGNEKIVSYGKFLAHGTPVIAAMIVGYLSNWGNHWILNLLIGKEGLGIFFLAFMIFSNLRSMATPFTQVLLPVLLRHSFENRDRLKEHIKGTFPLLQAVWCLGMLVLACFTPNIFPLLYPDRYQEGNILLSALLAGTLPSLLSSLYGPFFHINSQLWVSAIINTAVMIVSLGAALALIPGMGIMGAAVGAVASLWVGGIGYACFHQWSLRCWESGQFVISAAALGGVGLFMHFHGNLVWRLIVCGVVVSLIVFYARSRNYASSRVVREQIAAIQPPWLRKSILLIFAR